MKPGAHFAGTDWCLTDRYDAKSAEHRRTKKAIELGAGLPDLMYIKDSLNALIGAGFEIIESRDLTGESDPETPWYLPLTGRGWLDGAKVTQTGFWLTAALLRVLESAKLAPKGASSMVAKMREPAREVIKGAKAGVWTPMFYFHVRKPATPP
jgi:sterol 24-C-methyltransferase